MKLTNKRGKRVLLVGINFFPELTGIGKYSGEMIEWLSENGYNCTVVTSFPYYPSWEIQKPYTANFYRKELMNEGNVQLYRCPLYVPSKPTGKRRIVHDASFFFSAFIIILRLLFKKRCDYIFCMAPPFHLGFLGLFYRFFKGGEVIYHIQDLQIEAARDLKMIKSKSIFKILFRCEKFILKHSTHVSSISIGMIKKVSAKIQRKVMLFPNWVDTDLFSPLTEQEALKREWGFGPKEKIVLYSGSVGEKQGLESLIHVAKELENEAHIKFVICGDGPYKQELIKMAYEEGLKNMIFLPLQPISAFNNFLNMTDVHLVLQKKNACDLMMPSKLSAIWSCGGLALVTAEQGSTLHQLITHNNMGVVIDCENPELLRIAIMDCCNESNHTKKLNARLYAKAYLSKRSILINLMGQLQNEVSSDSKELQGSISGNIVPESAIVAS